MIRSVVLDTNVLVSAGIYQFARLDFPPPWFGMLLEEAHHQPKDPPPWPKPGPDPDDLIFLALAKRTGAVLVTGNLADFPDSARDGVLVLGPRNYLESLNL